MTSVTQHDEGRPTAPEGSDAVIDLHRLRVPYLGRSVRVVGPVANVDPKQMPHPMNQRGELGKALYNWRHNTISNDPITRIVFENHCADRAHVLNSAMRRIPKGKTNPERVPVPNPAEMSR